MKTLIMLVCLFKILIKENNKSGRKLTFFNLNEYEFSVDVKKIKYIYCTGAVCRIYELDEKITDNYNFCIKKKTILIQKIYLQKFISFFNYLMCSYY